MGGSVPDLKGRVRFVSDGSLRNLIDAVDLWKTGFEGQIRMSVSYYYPETAELKDPSVYGVFWTSVRQLFISTLNEFPPFV